MLAFDIQACSSETAARCGCFQTAHGQVITPVFMPVGTVGSVKAVHQHELDEAMLASIDPRLDAAFVRQLDVDASVASRSSFGGTAPERVAAAVAAARRPPEAVHSLAAVALV